MEWEVKDQRGIILVSEQGETMTSETFYHLSGKHVDWNQRVGGRIKTKRVGGHLRVYDANFIQGMRYRKGELIFRCVTICPNGQALLSPVNEHLTATAVTNTTDWEIV